jgi:hypothetical protein
MHNRASLVLSGAILLLSLGAIVGALSWPLKAKLFPLVVAIPLFFLAAAELISSLRDKKVEEEPREVPPDVETRRTWLAVAWIAGFFAAIVLLGFPVAVPAFVFLYLVLQGRERWLFSAIFAAVVWAIFYGLFDALLHLPFPPGLILDWLGLAPN